MRARVIAQRALAFALIWWVLAEGRVDSWGVGLVSVALALLASLRLSPPDQSRVSLAGLVGFIGFFLVQSARSGVQVAALALRPRLDLAPAMLDVAVDLPPGPARVLLIYTLALFPGTVSVRLDHNRLRLHVLDVRWPVEAGVRAAQAHIARILKVGP